MASTRIIAARKHQYCVIDANDTPSPAEAIVRPCLPLLSNTVNQFGGAVLVGLSPTRFAWDLQVFLEAQQLKNEQEVMTAVQMLAVEYDSDGGVNEQFKCVIQTPKCVLGCASKTTQRLYRFLGLGTVPLGGTVGRLDCHIGGVPGSCSETAASISYAPNTEGAFHISCESDEDTVTLNGRRLTVDMGPCPLLHEDICTIGARVFAFLLPG
jgi:hypothetical protein